MTDNQCVLHWIASKKLLTLFIQNRVKDITEANNINFRYVETSQNPADLATVGVSVQDLSTCELWWHGSKWLQNSEETWPTWDIPEITRETLEKIESETKGPKALYETSNLAEESFKEKRIEDREIHPPFKIDQTKCSSLLRLLRVTA